MVPSAVRGSTQRVAQRFTRPTGRSTREIRQPAALRPVNDAASARQDPARNSSKGVQRSSRRVRRSAPVANKRSAAAASFANRHDRRYSRCDAISEKTENLEVAPEISSRRAWRSCRRVRGGWRRANSSRRRAQKFGQQTRRSCCPEKIGWQTLSKSVRLTVGAG